MENQSLDAQPTNTGLLAVFWLYVLVPLVWGCPTPSPRR